MSRHVEGGGLSSIRNVLWCFWFFFFLKKKWAAPHASLLFIFSQKKIVVFKTGVKSELP